MSPTRSGHLVALLSLLIAGSVSAQGMSGGLDYAGSPGLLTLRGGEVGDHLELTGQLHLSVSHRPVVVYEGETEHRALVTTRLDMAATAGVSLWRRVQVELTFPAVLHQGTNDLGDHQPESSGLQDLRLSIRGNVLSQRSFPLALACLVDLVLPSGAEQSFMGEVGTPAGALALGLSRRLQDLMIGIDLGYRIRGTTELPGVMIDDELFWRVGAGYRLRIGGKELVPFTELVWATAAAQPFGSERSSPVEILGGARMWLSSSWATTIAGGTGVTRALNTPAFRVVAGVSYHRRPRGEPAPVVVASPDRDRNGVPDTSDACPEQPEDGEPPRPADGCPTPPLRPAPASSPSPSADTDKDGIVDRLDECPDQPEDKNGTEDGDGCPDGPQVALVVKKTHLLMLRPVHFLPRTAELHPDSRQLLNILVAELRKRTWIKKIRIEGYTDAQGPQALNLKLSRQRATVVRSYLISRGIAPSRLVAVGFGAARPIADNDTEQGREKNRRVEFNFIETARGWR